MSDDRPDPDALLRRLDAERTEQSRGRLKVFFGASPGVGKTFAMLEEARRRKAEGVDVVIGWVETHGRAETAALAEGIERLASRKAEHRAVVIEDFDLDAALARRPGLLLLDELAHTNAPGGRHVKRWQDAEELRRAGIDVYTTLNVQHLESLNDLVNQVTGVTVRETVPDRVLDDADAVEFVDLPPEELLKRLAEGKVYVPERAAQAARSFFRKGNLLALRELALRQTAEHVDADVRDYRRDHEIDSTWPVAERILVCVRPNPDSVRLVRAARRMAARLKAEWIVVYVESTSQPPLRENEKRALAQTVKLAEELGAETMALHGDSVSGALLAFARERNVSRIVVGKPTHPAWRDRLRGSLLDKIVRGSGEVDVQIISGEAGLREEPAAPRSWPASLAIDAYLWAVGTVVLCSLVCWAMFHRFDKSNLIMVYLLGVAFVATRFGRGPAALAAVLGVSAFNFFFVPPHLTFAVTDTQYLVTFAVMLVVSLLISTLAVRVRSQAEAAAQRERRTHVFYEMSRELAGAKAVEDVSSIVSRRVADVLRGEAAVLLPAADGRLAAPEGSDAPALREAAVGQWVFDNGRLAGLGTDTLPGASAIYLPLRGTQTVLAVLRVRPDPSLLPLAPDQMDLLETLARLGASSLERARLAEAAEQARVAVEAERLRSTLLSSVSHDLRTPLATITGAASTLLQPAGLPEEGRRELTAAIYEEAERLNRLVTNLLDMTRLESSTVSLNRDWQSVEEIVGTALGRVKSRLENRRVTVRVPSDLPLVHVDGLLVEQVLVNLLDNSLKYSGPGAPIEITAERGDASIEVAVADEGPGLPPGTEERVFDKFYRGGSTPQGFGLGLPIARAVLAAHGGSISARNRHPQGAEFRLTLPLETPPTTPREDGEHD